MALSLAVTGALVVVRGLPKAAGPIAGEAGAACTAPDGITPDAIRWVTVAEAREMVGRGEVAFVDCRPQNLFETGHISGSIHVAAERASVEPSLMDRLRSAGTVITYCDANSECERSLRMATLLQQSGLHDVRVLEGGMPAWLERGYPAESGSANN